MERSLFTHIDLAKKELSPPKGAAASTNLTTEVIVAAAKNGEAWAWPELYRKFENASVNYCRGRLNDGDLARDAFHEAVIEANAKLSTLRYNEAFAFWFRRILAKHCDRILRQHKPTAPLGEELPETQAPSQSEPQVAADIAELGRVLQASIESLAEPDRSICRSFYLEHQSYLEISRHTALPITTVKNRLFKARRILRKALGGWQRNQPSMALKVA